MDKENIIERRTGGLGSSDAAMVAKIGKNGCLSEADRFRIAVMLGLDERKPFYTKATELGNELEERIFEAIKLNYGKIISNPYYKSEKLSEKYGFDIFNHIDYEIEKNGFLFWFENKATIEDKDKTIQKYIYQLAWHSILLQEKAGNKGKLRLSIYNTNNFDKIGFDPEMLTILTIPVYNFPSNIKILEDELSHARQAIFNGLEIISNEIKNGFHYEKKEELEADNLPEKIQNEIIQISNILKQIEEQEKQIEDFKTKMLALMQSNSIKSIKNPYFNITVVPETITTSFDSKEFGKIYPELLQQYQKQSNRKAYLKIINK